MSERASRDRAGDGGAVAAELASRAASAGGAMADGGLRIGGKVLVEA